MEIVLSSRMGHRLLWTVVFVFVCHYYYCDAVETTGGGNNATEILLDLEDYLEQKIERFKLDLHKTYESSRLRCKRDAGHITSLPDKNALYEERIKIDSTESDYNQDISRYPLTCWTSVRIVSNHVALVGTSIGELMLLSFHGNKFSVLFHIQTDVAYELKHFVYRDEVWFVGVHRRGEGHYVQLYVYDGNNLFKKQAIHLQGRLDVELAHNRGTWYMGVVSKGIEASNAQFLLYNWRHTQFDMLAKSHSPGAQSVAMWDVEGSMYIAVARAMTGSPVFVYHERDDDVLTYIQIVRTDRPRKVLHFSVHANHYLLFLCSRGVTIYWWAGDQFLEWFILENTGNAEDAAILQLPNGEVTIAVAYKHSIHFYMEDFTSKYVLVYRLDLIMEHVIAGIDFFYRPDDYYYLIAKVKEGFKLMLPNMWRLNLTTHVTRNDDMWDPLVTCLVGLNDTLVTKRKDLDYIGSQIDRVWMTDREQTVRANIVVHGSMKANRELVVQDVRIMTDNLQVPQITNGKVRNGVLDARSNVEGLKADLNGVAFKSRDQTIHGPLRFTGPVTIGDGTMGNVPRDAMINDVPVSSLRDMALKVDGEQLVSEEFVVPDVLVHNLEMEGRLNKINPADMLLLHGNQVISGTFHFANPVVGDLVVKTINGLHPDSFVATNSPQTISGVKTFRTVQINKNIDVRGTTNNHDLSAVANRAILTTGNKPIPDNLEFVGPVIIRGNLVVKGRIDGILNLTAIATSAVDIESQQFIAGQKVFKSPVYVRGDVTVDGKTNGIDCKGELFTLNTEQNIPGNLSFLDAIHFVEDLDADSVNGMPLGREAVLKNVPHQMAIARKTFRGSLTVTGDVRTSPRSTLNGVYLSDLVVSASRPENFTLYGQTVFQDLVIDGQASARGTVNGISLSDFDTLLWRKSLNQVIDKPVTFTGEVVLEHDLEIEESIDGLNLDDDLVHTFKDEEIEGIKSFADDFKLLGPLRMAPGVRMNDFDLAQMSHVVVRTDGQPQVVYGRKMMPKLEILGDVDVRGLVNGMALSEELMLSDREQVVKGHVTLTSRTTLVRGWLRAERVDLRHDVNGVDLWEFARQAVMADYASQFPISNKNFLGGLKVQNIWSGRVGNVDIDRLFRKAVRIDASQVLESPTNFTDLEFVGFQVGTINGLDLHEHVDGVVLSGDSIVFGPKTVAGSLKVNGDLKTFGPINGVDVRDLAGRALYRDADNVITAPFSFAQDLDVDRLYLGKSSNMDEISWDDLVFLDREEFLPGSNHFQDSLVVEGNVLTGLVDGCDLKDLAESALYTDREHQTVDGLKTIQNLMVHGDVKVDGPVNGLDLNRFASGILRKSSDQSVTGAVGFYSQLNVKQLSLTDMVNGNELDLLFRDAVLKSTPQEIRGLKTLAHPEGVLFGSNLTVDGNTDVGSDVDGVDISELRDTTVYKHGDQIIFGHKIFQDVETLKDIRVAGLVNEVKIPEDIVLPYGDDVVAADTTFSGPIGIEGNLILSGTADGIDLDSFLRERVTLRDDDVILANVTFVAPVQIGSLELGGNINDIPVASLVTRTGSHMIGGNKKFLGDVRIDGDLNTLSLNDMDVRDLDGSTIRHNRDEIVRGMMVFRDNVQMDGDISVAGLANGLNVGNMETNLKNLQNEEELFVEDLTGQAVKQNLHLKNQFLMHKHLFSEFAYFDLVQVLPIKMTQLFTSVTYGFSRPSFVAKPASHLFGWSADGCASLDCCSQNTFVFRVENDGQLAYESGPHKKRLFAFVFSNGTLFTPGYLNGFLLWTNTSSRSIDCGIANPEETVIVSLHGTGLSPLESKQATTNFQAEYSPYVEDAKVVEIDSDIYMIVAYSYSKKDATSGPTIVYLYDKHTNMWSHFQTLQTHGARKLDITQILMDRTVTFLTISTRPVSGNDSASPYTPIYRWEPDTKRFSLMKEIPSSWPSSVLWVDSDHDLYLFVANEKSLLHRYFHLEQQQAHFKQESYSDPVRVYKYNSAVEDFVSLRDIGIKGVVSMSAYKLAGEIFVALASRIEDCVYIVQLLGFNGFAVVQRIPTHRVRDVHVYWSKEYRLHLAITSDFGTLVLRSVIRGQSLLPVEGRPLFIDYEALISPGNFVPHNN